MTITYPMNAPTTAESSESTMTLIGRNSIAYGESPFTYKQFVHDYDGDAWMLIISIDPLDRPLVQAWGALLTALRGRYGTFLWGPALQSTPLGIGGGTPLVMGAGQSGRTLNVDGCTPSTQFLKAGDLFSISNRLYQNLIDVSANGSGQATLDIWPKLRGTISDNAPLTLSSPKGTWRLSSNEQILYEAQQTKLFPITLVAQEAL